jgi:hypothetical protein
MPKTARIRTVFYISDRTAITAETLGHSLLAQFEDMDITQVTFPFIDTVDKVKDVLKNINQVSKNGARPIVFSTLIKSELREIIMTADAVVIDLFDTFIKPLEVEFKTQSSQMMGQHPALLKDLDVRIDAVNFAISNDDGISTKDYDKADVVLTGVSRAGKTPTCLYLGLQFGIYAANYPLTEDDLQIEYKKIPGVLVPYRDKLFGLTINAERLQKIRSERRPNSRYASLHQCQQEVAMAEFLFVSKNIPFINITTMSVEEIAATIMHRVRLKRRLF